MPSCTAAASRLRPLEPAPPSALVSSPLLLQLPRHAASRMRAPRRRRAARVGIFASRWPAAGQLLHLLGL